MAWNAGVGLSAPYFAYRQGTRTVYALTEKRALILTLGRKTKAESYREKDMRSRGWW